MTIDLLYGRDGLSLTPPDTASAHVIEKPAFLPCNTPDEQIAWAFVTPHGCAPLAELARGKSSACILICDLNLPVPSHLFLRPMIETLTR